MNAVSQDRLCSGSWELWSIGAMASARSPRDDELADDLLEYINDSDTQFHAVEQAKARLDAAGYMRLSERQSWDGLSPGGRYYFTRNDSTLVAFAVGARYEPGNGFYILGAHTDRWAGVRGAA